MGIGFLGATGDDVVDEDFAARTAKGEWKARDCEEAVEGMVDEERLMTWRSMTRIMRTLRSF